jgi:hypothetical protein
MTFDGAVIKKDRVTFAIAVVRENVLRVASDRATALAQFTAIFRLPTVLMAQDSRGVPEYFGRPDIVRFLANIHPSQIPWRKYTLT